MKPEKVRLLLIEDDEVDRELVSRLLGQTYDITEVSRGSDGLALVAGDPPDIVLLDYRLPDMESFEILDRFHAEGIPVIVLTGEESPDVIVSAMRRGAQDYLLKWHLSKVALEQAIDNALEKSSLQRSVLSQQRQLAEQAATLVEQNSKIRTLASALILAEQRERKNVSQILHDHIQQLLYGIQMRVHLLTQDLPQQAAALVEGHLIEANKLLENAISAARTLSVDLSPPVLQDEGIGDALQWLVLHMERVHGLRVNFQVKEDGDYRAESDELHILIFQLVRELLFNVVKHANVTEAYLQLFSENGHQKILVRDEGAGFDQDHVLKSKWKPEQGYGLYSVRERLALFGGQLEIESTPGAGTRMTIVLPDT